MGTFNTGIPLITRYIVPPPTPVTSITVNKTIAGLPADETAFLIFIMGDSGYIVSGASFTQSSPYVIENVDYGTYTITESVTGGYSQTSITPQTFVISADNPTQVVEIVNAQEDGYGKLYNAHVVEDARNVAAVGWHVASIDDYDPLPYDLTDLELMMIGYRYFADASFNAHYGVQCEFWGDEEEVLPNQHFIFETFENNKASFAASHKGDGLIVRLVADSTLLTEGATGTYTGNDGQTYNTKCISGKEWMTENLKEIYYRYEIRNYQFTGYGTGIGSAITWQVYDDEDNIILSIKIGIPVGTTTEDIYDEIVADAGYIALAVTGNYEVIWDAATSTFTSYCNWKEINGDGISGGDDTLYFNITYPYGVGHTINDGNAAVDWLYYDSEEMGAWCYWNEDPTTE